MKFSFKCPFHVGVAVGAAAVTAAAVVTVVRKVRATGAEPAPATSACPCAGSASGTGAGDAGDESKTPDVSQTVLSVATMNAGVREAQYAVRGELVIRAKAHEQALARGEARPFTSVVYCNIGNPHALGQSPLTFPRQVLALLQHMPLADHPLAGQLFAADAIARARAIHAATPGGMGAYSESQGLSFVRQHVAEFIEARDGFPADADSIFLTAGASPAVQMTLRVLIRDDRDAVLVPVPQYPLYSGSITLFGGRMVGYNLSEDGEWGLDVDALRRAYAEATASGLRVRAMVVINPGNPTGNALPREQMEQIATFCSEHKLVLLSDEVYQANVYHGTWTSFKKVVSDMGLLTGDASSLQLVSFHSVSKGLLGECGRRGGYMEVVGIDSDVMAQFVKLASLSLCPNLVGQVMVDLMVKPPVPGDVSYDSYAAESAAIFASLKRRAEKLVAALNELHGVSCCTAQGAMYVFPRIELPAKAVAAAEEAGKPADTFYCLQLLDATGLVVVPGSGFGQADGTFHFRSTFLPPEDALDAVVASLKTFHAAFMRKYAPDSTA